MELRPFHIAFPVTDLEEARRFYCGVLGCIEGRSTESWVDFGFYGNSLSAYLHPEEAAHKTASLLVDLTDRPKYIPVRHFGLVLHWDEWEFMTSDLQRKSVRVIIGPIVRFEGKNGEQGTTYFADPSGNILEIKAFRNLATRFLPFSDSGLEGGAT